MSDVLLFQTPDGGEIKCENGQVSLTDGPETSLYLSLFGGNEEDAGLTSTESKEWWGNKIETEPSRKYRGKLQFLLRTLPLVPSNLPRFEDAATEDLQWMTEEIADAVAVNATMPALNRVKFEIGLAINGKTTKFSVTPPEKKQ